MGIPDEFNPNGLRSISLGSAQRFLATHTAVYNHFNVQRHLIFRRTLRDLRSRSFAGWREVAAA